MPGTRQPADPRSFAVIVCTRARKNFGTELASGQQADAPHLKLTMQKRNVALNAARRLVSQSNRLLHEMPRVGAADEEEYERSVLGE
jgi:hypothetical protein